MCWPICRAGLARAGTPDTAGRSVHSGFGLGRAPLPDALRALAMVGVIVVNAVSYTVAPSGPPLGLPEPGMASIGAHALAAMLLHGKAYPLLAFLFGAGLVMSSQRRGAAPQDARRRVWRLLVLGVLHGALVYFGDILTMYAVCGLWLLRHTHERPGVLRRRLYRACGWALLAVVANLLLLAAAFSVTVELTDAAASFDRTVSWSAQGWLNGSTYLVSQAAALFLFLPILRVAVLAGMLAARLRMLTHSRWQPLWRRWLQRCLPVGLVLNAVYAAGLTAAVLRHDEFRTSLYLVVAPALGWWLTVSLVAWAVLHPGRWVQFLAPLGRRTLSLYLLHSVLCVLMFSGAGLGWPLPLVAGWVWGLGIWGAGLVAARRLEALHWRGPFEAWLARGRAVHV